MRKLNLLGLLLLLLPGISQAWWNADWAQRKKITITPPADLKQPLTQVVVPVRLHTGNFVFVDAKEDGADLRFVAGDDKTPLKFHIERFDGINELAVVWVQLPKITPGAAPDTVWMYYGNPKASPADDAKATYDVNQTAVLHFSESAGLPKDQTAYANNPAQSTAALTPSGLMGGGATFNGQSKITFPSSPSLKVSANGLTFSAWIKPADVQRGSLFTQKEGAQSVDVGLADGHVIFRVTNAQGAPAEVSTQGSLTAGGWHHVVAVVAQDSIALYVDGKVSGSTSASFSGLGGEAAVGASMAPGAGFKGDMDEVELANIARPAAWAAVAFASQGAEGKLISLGEPEDSGGGEGNSYFSILLHAVTLDGWVIIGLLMVMMVIAVWVMISKTIFVVRMDRANQVFRDHFKKLSGELVSIDRGDVDDKDDLASTGSRVAPKLGSVGAMATSAPSNAGELKEFRHSSLYRIYHVGVRELLHRFDVYEKKGKARILSPQAIDSLKASLDASLVKELHRLNSKMVLLTIAISGGPFLGLLGTVVGVMITFAAIAAVGDVNVNSIAPGIAAALVATVAGLGVAIPALFGYNYLASRIKNISTDMQVFSDEFITKLAEDYAV